MAADLVSQAHLERLAEAMAPDPGAWRFEGEVTDAGGVTAKCACGANIRFMFWISRSDGAKLAIGSICIEKSVPWLIESGAATLAGNLQDALERHKAALDDAKHRARESAVEARLEGLRPDAAALAMWVTSIPPETWLPDSARAIVRRVAEDDGSTRALAAIAGSYRVALAQLAATTAMRGMFPVPQSDAAIGIGLEELSRVAHEAREEAGRLLAQAESGRSATWAREKAERSLRIAAIANESKEYLLARAS